MNSPFYLKYESSLALSHLLQLLGPLQVLLVCVVPVLQLLDVYRLSVRPLTHYLREDLLSLFVFVEFYEFLHEDADS